ncbi:hypothetical protein RFI_12896 [Reticulomyxa filosa]|uniref:RGS domain-containing protein n=1 Tax=Reticulomyxa filosa TaxID=46433 RepID=X6NFZ2_RETFI|nr:hypothetical protein RFI_12896 [Reticulomyxa filosa]|eukprot:ETO24262.1 hypothetical protein RFI_12896 [Reticulomyxa filosa]
MEMEVSATESHLAETLKVIVATTTTTEADAAGGKNADNADNKDGNEKKKNENEGHGIRRMFRPKLKRKKSKIIKQVYIPLEKLIRDDSGFDAFMKHCLKEFSSENLLCVVECVQFQQFAFETLWKPEETEMKLIYTGGTIDIQLDRQEAYDTVNQYKLWKGLPPSEIVFDEKLDIAEKGVKLIEKYIRPSAPFEGSFENRLFFFLPCFKYIHKYYLHTVNISYSMRNDYFIPYKKKAFPNTNDKNWILYFQPIISELIHLMRDSHSRFVKTEDYKQLLLHKRLRKHTDA